MKKLSLKNSDNLTVDEAFEDFKGHCRIINLSGETIKLYQYQFNVFHRFLDDETFLISDVTLATVNGFILELRSDKHVTVNTYLRGLRAFLYYCMEMDYMTAFKIRIPKVDKKLKETYTDAELNVLLKKPNLKTCGFSEYKIWVFSNYLLGTGNRISTALSLKKEYVQMFGNDLSVNFDKFNPLDRPVSSNGCKKIALAK